MSDRRGYAICCLQRTGSTLFGQLLGSTGTLGNPQEWFNPGDIRRMVDPAYPDEGHAMARRIPTDGATPNGVYGVKLFPVQIDRLRGIDWPVALPGLRWIHLRREDRLGAAISAVRAAQTRQYRTSEAAQHDPVYDADAIQSALRSHALENARWQVFFDRNAIAPLPLTYEEICADPQTAVDTVAELMDVPPVPINPVEVGVEIQRDSVSDEWRARFVTDRRDLRRIDWLTPGWRASLRRLLRR